MMSLLVLRSNMYHKGLYILLITETIAEDYKPYEIKISADVDEKIICQLLKTQKRSMGK